MKIKQELSGVCAVGFGQADNPPDVIEVIPAMIDSSGCGVGSAIHTIDLEDDSNDEVIDVDMDVGTTLVARY